MITFYIPYSSPGAWVDSATGSCSSPRLSESAHADGRGKHHGINVVTLDVKPSRTWWRTITNRWGVIVVTTFMSHCAVNRCFSINQRWRTNFISRRLFHTGCSNLLEATRRGSSSKRLMQHINFPCPWRLGTPRKPTLRSLWILDREVSGRLGTHQILINLSSSALQLSHRYHSYFHHNLVTPN